MLSHAARCLLCGAGCLVATATAAPARPAGNPALPRSPYTLPEPTYREPDVEAVLEGNGKLHSSGQWRHWGDKRNTGETLQQLIAPRGVLELGGRANNLPD